MTRQHPNRWLFQLIGWTIPVLFFVLLEGALRLLNIGKSYPLFIENPVHTDYLLPRPDVIERYFATDAPTPNVTLEANFLLKDKPENGLRFFVQGGSTAAGYPYGLGTSIAGMLDQRLKPSLPNHYVEVVNTAFSAVNSFTLLDLADEIIAEQPDGVLIYAGHNEYLGILGVGSNFTLGDSYWLTRSMLWLKDFRLYQLLQNLVYSLTSSQTSAAVTLSERRTVMSQVAKHKNIAWDSDLYHRGLAQFERNMSALIQRYQKANIPVFLATIGSNLKDHKPFESNEIPVAFDKAIAEAKTLQSLLSLSQQWRLSDSADLHYQLGSALYRLGDYESAKRHLTLAKQHDLLRFRAPEAINDIIRKLSQQDNVFLVDAQQRLSKRSTSQIIGKNVMLEHLHPNVEGYFVIADSFYSTMQASKLFENWRSVSLESAWRNRPILPAEEYFGYASVLTLMSDYPFTDTPQSIRLPNPADWQQQLGRQQFDKSIDWLTMAKQSAAQYKQQNNTHMWLKSAQIIADALPHDPLANLEIGELFYKQKRYAEALHYLKRAKRAGSVGSRLSQMIQLSERRIQND